MLKTILAKRCFDGTHFHDDTLIRVESGKIHSVEPNFKGCAEFETTDLVCSGFIDVQVNGGGGALFNNAPSSITLTRMVKAHAQYGTTAMLPTLITDELDVMHAAANAVSEAIASKQAGILGIHFEGPHLSIAKKGIHPSASIRPLKDEEMQLLMRKDLGIVKVTLAPEQVSEQCIRKLVDAGVIVSLGHSNASSEQTVESLNGGATGFTHLFNAMSPMVGREPGVTGTALQRQDVYCGLIVDFLHVHKQNCQLAYQCKGPQKLVLVTDAMHHVGSEQSRLPYLDTFIQRNGDKLTIEDGTLAGSALDMASAVRNCHQTLNLPLDHVITMASRTPATWLGIQNKRGAVQPGYQADLVALDQSLTVTNTWIGGEHVFSLSTHKQDQEL